MASMGPRSIDRGNNVLQRAYACSAGRLQWGRDQSIAEMSVPVPGVPMPQELQWGRDQSIAEITPDRQTHTGTIRFNGAAINRSRKSVLRVWRAGGRHASMGPRSIDRGNMQTARQEVQWEAWLQWGRDQSIAEIKS